MTSNIWNEPTEFDFGLLKSTHLNQQVKENLVYLHERNLAIIEKVDEADTSAANPLGSVDLTTTGNDVIMWLKGQFVKSDAAADIYFDVQIDLDGGGTIFASTHTGSGSPRGLWYNRSGTTPVQSVDFFTVVPASAIPAGTHTFTLTMAASTGTATLILNNTVNQFIVQEWGIGQTNQEQWGVKKDWRAGENVTKGKLDTALVNKMRRLKNRNYVYRKEVLAANLTTASTSFVILNAAHDWKISILTEGNDVRLTLCVALFTTVTNGTVTYMDVLVDDDYYVSSLTNTPLSDGIINVTTNANAPRCFCFDLLVRNLDAGWHTFELYFKTGVGASPAAVGGVNIPTLFVAEEYCLTS